MSRTAIHFDQSASIPRAPYSPMRVMSVSAALHASSNSGEAAIRQALAKLSDPGCLHAQATNPPLAAQTQSSGSSPFRPVLHGPGVWLMISTFKKRGAVARPRGQRLTRQSGPCTCSFSNRLMARRKSIRIVRFPLILGRSSLNSMSGILFS